MQQCTHIGLNYSAKFSHLIETKTKRWFKARIAYYPNSVSTFNVNALTISLSGDVHPLPGPISRSTCKIPVRCTDRKKKTTSCSRTCDESNCIKINSKRSNSSSLSQSLNFGLWNVRSVKNKALSPKDYTFEHDLVFLALTETWLHSGESDSFFVGELCPKGYIFHHTPRENSRGGGVVILVKKSLRVKKLCSANFSSFENVVALAEYPIGSIRFVVIYRPPSSHIKAFLQDFVSLLEQLVPISGNLLFVGDFNFKLDSNNTDATKLHNLLESFNLKQHVATPTHFRGHTLDLIITRSEDDLVDGIVVRDPPLSDHFAVHCTLKLSKPPAEQHEIRYRKLRSVDMSALCKDLRDSIVLQENITDLPTLVDKYETELTRVLDIHSPEKKRTIMVRPAAAWYNGDIDREKGKRRKLERRWRKSRLVIDRELYKEQCKVVSSLIKKAKENYYSNIQENKGNQKVLFNTVTRLLHRNTEKCYPTAPFSEVLADRFADFFCQKIEVIRNDLFARYTPVANSLVDAQACCAELTEF